MLLIDLFCFRFADAFGYIAVLDPKTYAKCFSEPISGRSSSQLIESLWAAIMRERVMPLASLYLGILRKFGFWVEKHR